MEGKRKRKRPGENGFTLLEILISIAILSVILSVIYGAYQSSVQTIQIVQVSSELSRKARLVLDRMTGDLEGAYISTFATPSESVKFAFVGEDRWDGPMPADSLAFTSTTRKLYESDAAHSVFAEIGYFLETDEETGLKRLIRRESTVMDQDIATGGIELEMASGVRGLDLKYVDADDKIWDSWDSSTTEHARTLPRMVEIHLLLDRNDGLSEQPPLEYFTKAYLEMSQPQQ